MSYSLPSKKSMLVLSLLFVSITCFGDTYALDDNLSDTVVLADTNNAPTEAVETTDESNTQETNDVFTTTPNNNLQLLEKLEAINLIANNPAYEHLNDILSKLEQEESTNNESLDFSLIQTSPHELALTQILSEICPPLIDETLHAQFSHSYQAHLKLLMPTLDPDVVMPKINEHPEYAKILQGVREWTMSYPSNENKELCVEFAEVTF